MKTFIELRREALGELADAFAAWERVVGVREPGWRPAAVPFTAAEDAATRLVDEAIDRYVTLRGEEPAAVESWPHARS